MEKLQRQKQRKVLDEDAMRDFERRFASQAKVLARRAKHLQSKPSLPIFLQRSFARHAHGATTRPCTFLEVELSIYEADGGENELALISSAAIIHELENRSQILLALARDETSARGGKQQRIRFSFAKHAKMFQWMAKMPPPMQTSFRLCFYTENATTTTAALAGLRAKSPRRLHTQNEFIALLSSHSNNAIPARTLLSFPFQPQLALQVYQVMQNGSMVAQISLRFHPINNNQTVTTTPAPSRFHHVQPSSAAVEQCRQVIIHFAFGPNASLRREQDCGALHNHRCAFCARTFRNASALLIHIQFEHVFAQWKLRFRQASADVVHCLVENTSIPPWLDKTALQRRKFYRSTVLEPLPPCEVEDNSDYEDAERDFWISHKSERMLEDFQDISPEERGFMAMWNAHVLHEAHAGENMYTLADGRVPQTLHAFIQQHRAALLQRLRHEFTTHLLQLWDTGVISQQTVWDCLLELN